MNWFSGTERIDKIGDEIFFFGAGADGFFLVFDDDLVVGDFNDFGARDGEFGVEERLDKRSANYELLDAEIVIGDRVIGDAPKFGTFFGLNSETV